ncbi:MAG TPA: hypothetical protein VEC99_09695 [Clostridia bacterium]|nr:hypothetical protein [Clostridia bacterium]
MPFINSHYRCISSTQAQRPLIQPPLREMTFRVEFLTLLKKHQIAYDERHLWERASALKLPHSRISNHADSNRNRCSKNRISMMLQPRLLSKYPLLQLGTGILPILHLKRGQRLRPVNTRRHQHQEQKALQQH